MMAVAGRAGERPIRPICGRSDVMSPPQSKLRAVLAGLAVIVVVGLSTPIVLGTVTVSLWSRSGVFDVSGPTRLALFLLVAVAWMAWLRIIVGLCLDVVSALRHPDNAPASRRSEGPFGRMGPRLRPACPSRHGDGCGTGRCDDRCRADIRTLACNQ